MSLTRLMDIKEGRTYDTLILWARAGILRSAVKREGVWYANEDEVMEVAVKRRQGRPTHDGRCKCGGKHLAQGLCRRCYDKARQEYRYKREMELKRYRGEIK